MSSSILIVEDDEMIREMMDIILTQAGYQVAKAASGEAALELLRTMRFSLMLLDVHMPRMSGLDVLQTIRRRGRVPPPVIMVTANRNVGTVQEAMRLGCAAYVAKPFTPDELLSRVRKVLGAGGVEAAPAASKAG